MKKALALSLILIMVLGLMSAAMAAVGNAAGTDTISIPVTKEWKEDAAGNRPDSITVKLMDEDGKEIGDSQTLTATDNWSGAFIVNKSVFSGDTAKTYNLTLEETPLKNYTTEYNNPQVKYTPFTVGEWDRTEPCDKKNFNLRNINAVVANHGNDYVVWTENELTDAQKALMVESVKTIGGMHGAKSENFTFIYGSKASCNGLNINNDVLSFDDTSKWSLWAGGSYELEKVEVKGGTITNTYKQPDKININVKKEWNMNGLNNIAKPNDVTIQLLKNGEETGKTLKLNENNRWQGTFTNLENDGAKYSIKEVKVEGYDSEIITSEDGFTVKNTLITYPVQIKKEASGLPEGAEYPNVIVDIKKNGKVIKTIKELEANGNAQIVQLPAGEYTVEEQIETAYVDGYDLDVTNAELEMTAPKEAERSAVEDAVEPVAIATVINTYTKMEENTGSLIVKKMVSGNGADRSKAFTFKVTLTLPTPASAPVEIADEDGLKPFVPSEKVIAYDDIKDKFNRDSLTMTFRLSHGEIFTITGLPAGTTYTVTEDSEDYTPTVPDNAKGAIKDREAVSVTFTNTKNYKSHVHHDHVPPVVYIPPKTGDMTIWQSILHFLGIR